MKKTYKKCEHMLQYKNANIFDKYNVFILSNYDDCLNASELYYDYDIKNFRTNIPHSIEHIINYDDNCTKIIMPNSIKFCEKYENISMLTQQRINKNVILFIKNDKQRKTTKIKTKLTNIIFVNNIILYSTVNYVVFLLKKLFTKIEKINNLQIIKTNFQNFYFNLFIFLKNTNKLEFVNCSNINTIILRNIYALFFKYCRGLNVNNQNYLKNIHLLKIQQ